MVYSRGAAKAITNFNFVQPLLVNKRNYSEVWKRSPCAERSNRQSGEHQPEVYRFDFSKRVYT